ncbi:YARHG domain-containing protein [Ferruginibacter sp.]|nr:YARHG domain-containing protein [Ferruginibacter sp.]
MTTTFSLGQIPKYLFNEVTEETYNTKDFTSDVKPIKQRIGVYHFGESEGEWDFVILQNEDSLNIQIWNGTWATNLYTKKQCWQRQCKTFNKVSVEGNKILFGEYSGLFTAHKYENKTTNALLLFCDPIEERNYGKDSAEVGHYSTSIDIFYDDKERYQLSINVQPDNYFKGKTKQELKIMRNTIYANYGLIFQAGGEMEKYFRKKDWYNPFLKDVSNCLTDIEKKNIQAIARLEQQ